MMEAVSVVVFAASALIPPNHPASLATVLQKCSELSWPQIVFMCMWEAHYCHRTLIYPWRSSSRSPWPILAALGGIYFNVLNGFINGRWIGTYGCYPNDHLFSTHVSIGIVLFLCGMATNIYHDEILLNLRRLKGQKSDDHQLAPNRYVIPQGALFRYISCPHYFGEIVEWIGFSIATWSPAAALFAISTATVLISRALVIHRNYHERFATYPKDRRAIIPFCL
jgi:hypothetical protein